MSETHPPQDLTAEQSVLGAMMISTEAIPAVTDILKPEDFYRPAHATVYRAIVDLYSGGDPVDAVTVSAELGKRGKLQNIGGAPYLLDLIQTVPTASNSVYYARIVADKAKLRKLVEFGIRCQALGYSDAESDDVDSVVAQAEVFLREVRKPRERAIAFSDLVTEWQKWAETSKGDVIQTPWYKLNEILGGGLQKSRLYIFGGRPGMGKSISALNIAALAAESDKTVLIFSLEMPRTEVASRLLASGAQVNFQQVIRRQMQQDTEDRIKHYAAQNAGMRLYCVDQASLTVEQIVRHCRAHKDLDLIVVDYAQLVAPTDKRVNRDQQIAHVSRTLKVLAKDLNIAVVLAAQLNRQVIDSKTGKSRQPALGDLRESGSLEADADAVLLLHRPDEDDGTVDIVVAKNRSGLTGNVPLMFVGQQARLG